MAFLELSGTKNVCAKVGRPNGCSPPRYESSGYQIEKGNRKGTFIILPSNAILAVVLLLTFVTVVALTDAPTTTPTTVPTASVTGTWTSTLRIEDLQIDVTTELKQNDTTITGTVIAGVETQALNLTNGNITGSEVQFTVDRVAEIGTFRTKYRGKLNGDEIRGTVEFGWMDIPDHPGTSKVDWLASRAKDGTHPSPGVQ